MHLELFRLDYMGLPDGHSRAVKSALIEASQLCHYPNAVLSKALLGQQGNRKNQHTIRPVAQPKNQWLFFWRNRQD